MVRARGPGWQSSRLKSANVLTARQQRRRAAVRDERHSPTVRSNGSRTYRLPVPPQPLVDRSQVAAVPACFHSLRSLALRGHAALNRVQAFLMLTTKPTRSCDSLETTPFGYNLRRIRLLKLT